MITIIQPSRRGVTYGIGNIIKAMQENQEQLLELLKISRRLQDDRTKEFSFAAVSERKEQ